MSVYISDILHYIILYCSRIIYTRIQNIVCSVESFRSRGCCYIPCMKNTAKCNKLWVSFLRSKLALYCMCVYFKTFGMYTFIDGYKNLIIFYVNQFSMPSFAN